LKKVLTKYIPIVFKPKLAIWIFFGFILFTIIGILSHEMGHIAVARILGYKTTLHYGSMNYYDGPNQEEFDQIWYACEDEIKTGQSYPKKARRQELLLEIQYRSWLIRAGGPLQTMITGTIGLLLLYKQRENIEMRGMQFIDWMFVFLSLFWLRELANPMLAAIIDIARGEFSPFSGRSDEIFLARSLGWWGGSISFPLATIAAWTGLYVIFKILPKEYRLTFVTVGLLGGIVGFAFWLKWIGPILIP
jgi:hypothetical protein